MTARTELITERLLLRPFQVGDVDDALRYRDDREFARFLPHIPQPFTRRDAEVFVALNMSEPWEQSPTFAVVLEGKLIGTVNFEIDAKARSAMLGYAIGRTWWGQGIATEAASAAIVWATESLVLARIWACTDATHARSRRVLEKLGLRCEGRRAAARRPDRRGSVRARLHPISRPATHRARLANVPAFSCGRQSEAEG